MRDLIVAEWRKIWTGRAWWAVSAAALLMCVMADAGMLQQELAKTPRPDSTREITSTLVQGWFMVELAAAVVAMLAVTREFGNGAISRSVLLSGGRGRLVAAKLTAAACCGAAFALVAGALAAVSPWLFMAGREQRPEWTMTTTWTLLGVMLVVVTGALWGALLGLLIRQQVAAILVLLISTWLVGEGLLRLVPAVGRFTIDEAMASVYRGGNEHLLPIPWALLVLAAWLAAGTVAARALFLRRDLP
ncbi:ABC transporter permease [Streptomyces roseirectus]|uniref:ABC transporter permease n=1 Tax=Streptomyces roseirectus TaxID=2768066 RepID=A0A7H0IIP7_9ACTN|nr:ABC transporter permease [Streptomyces roseirectus]QNP72663.1 ABC transporter permease [Streptomyces roseirectus]